MTGLTKDDIIKSYKTVTDCTYCGEDDIDLIDVGYPISGSNFVCPKCHRTDADMYDNEKGLVYRKITSNKDDLVKLSHLKEADKSFGNKIEHFKKSILMDNNYTEDEKAIFICTLLDFLIIYKEEFGEVLKDEK